MRGQGPDIFWVLYGLSILKPSLQCIHHADHDLYIYHVYIDIHMNRRQNQLLIFGRKIEVIFFWVGPIALQCFVQINTK